MPSPIPLKNERRSPHGERGLKYVAADLDAGNRQSLSSWRAWIEMSLLLVVMVWERWVALLMESVD